MYSELISKIVPADSSNYANGRTRNGDSYGICKITPHHMSGRLTAQRCGEIFQNPSRNASSNYGIGYDGQIYGYVDEENRAWTSSNWMNDIQAITIECSNSGNNTSEMTDATWNSLIELCVDICKRYNFELVYDGTPNGSLTRHNMFANTDCPGSWLQARLPELAEIVNSRLKECNLKYMAHIQEIGWTGWQDAGTVEGTIDESRRIEAIILEGSNGLDIEYRAHVQDIGWMDWKKSGEVAGTTGESLRLEALEIKSNKVIEAQEYLQDVGWMPVSKGTDIVIGTVGKSLRLEAFKILVNE